MKHLKRKLIGSIVILLVLTGVFGVVLFHAYQAVNRQRNNDENMTDIQAIRRTVDITLDLYRQASESVDQTYLAKAELTAATYRNHPGGGYDEKPLMLPGGAVIGVDGGKVAVPDGFPGDVMLDAGMFTEPSGIAVSGSGKTEEAEDTTGSFSVYYSRIRGPYYYIEWEDEESNRLRKLSRFDIYHSLAGIEEIYHTDFILFGISGAGGQSLSCKYSSHELNHALAVLFDEHHIPMM